jgi:hypothetical protein
VAVGPAALLEAAAGVAIEYDLHDGPLIFTLTQQEAAQLAAAIAEQPATKAAQSW